MAAVEFSLDPRDRETYGGPEWVVFDRDALDDLTFSDLNRYEKQLGVSIAHLLTGEFAKATALGIKGVVWLARQMAGQDESFASFDIRTRRVRHRAAGADAGPPVSGSSEPSSETAP
jgi:hypothetical protein